MVAELRLPQAKPGLPGYTLPPVPSQGTRVILLRHGRSTLNDAGCYQGSSDESGLTPQGWLASRQVGQYLSHCTIDHLYTSPLRRAQQTVQALLPCLQGLRRSKPGFRGPSPAITTRSDLREIDLPAWEGLPYEEVKRCFPEAYHCWQTTPQAFAMVNVGGELERWEARASQPQDTLAPVMYPVREVYHRAREFWRSTLPRHRGETLLVVSHGSTLQALVNTALGLPIDQHHHLQQTHSGLTVIDFPTPGLGQGHLHWLNLTTPIGEQLPKLKAGKQGLRLVLLPCQAGVRPDSSLATLVQGHPIAACVVEDHPCCHPSQRALLAHHPETVVLSVGRADFLHHWQRSVLQSLHSVPPTELTTVAAVCHQAQAESFVHNRLGRIVPLLPNALTVLHYPRSGVAPMLQSLNSRAIP